MSLRDSVPIRVMNLNDARQLSGFMPIIMLIPQPVEQIANGLSPTTMSKSNFGSSGISQFHELFELETIQSQVDKHEKDFTFGDVKIKFSSMEASRKGELITLKLKEFKTLQYFSQNVRRVISRDELLNKVWGYENYPCTRTVDNHIWQLRQKFEENPSRPIHFQTVHGVGYRFLP
jgi:DNA-binding response OmpR family regulator